jgi:hypothetical protein
VALHSDKILSALTDAIAAWDGCVYGSKNEKLHWAHTVHKHGVFSIPQIAKIVRLPARYIYDEMAPNNPKGGGRFDPQTLSALKRIRHAHVLGEKISHSLLKLAISGGTSYSCIVTLTGIPYSTYYPEASLTQEELAALPEKKMKFAPKISPELADEIRRMWGQRYSKADIARATGLEESSVSRFLRREKVAV